MLIARHWRNRKSMIFLFVLEFLFTVAVLTLYALAQPDEYRTKLRQDGADNGFNSSPGSALYSYANHETGHKTPIVWSQFITDYNVVISVVSMFILLAKVVMFMMHTFVPLLSVLTHVVLIVLYAVSTYAQSSSDLTDPEHRQKGAPWYITKSCSVARLQSNYTYCQQAKACFATTVCMLVIFVLLLILAIVSSIPSRKERMTRGSDIERSNIPSYAPMTRSAVPIESEKGLEGVQLAPLRTPRTVAFHSLEGSPGSGGKALPFREHYGGS